MEASRLIDGSTTHRYVLISACYQYINYQDISLRTFADLRILNESIRNILWHIVTLSLGLNKNISRSWFVGDGISIYLRTSIVLWFKRSNINPSNDGRNQNHVGWYLDRSQSQDDFSKKLTKPPTWKIVLVNISTPTEPCKGRGANSWWGC